LALRVSVRTGSQRLQPLEQGYFCGIDALPQRLGIAFPKCSFKLALPVGVFYVG